MLTPRTQARKLFVGLGAPMLLFVSLAWGQNKGSITDPMPQAGPTEPTVSGSDKLKGSLRSLNAPEGSSASAKAEKPIVLIYYANEMSADDTERRNVQRMADGLRSLKVAEIDASADALEADLTEFPKSVENDVAEILKAHEKQAKHLPDVVIFTNAAARAGKLQLARAAEPGKLSEAEFKIPTKRAGLYQPYPLCSHEVLKLALARTAELFPATEHEYVLITKSHGSSVRIMIPRYPAIVTEANLDKFVQRAKVEFEQQLAAKLKSARPLCRDDKSPLVDAQGHGLVEKDGVIYWQQVGKVTLTTDESGKTYLVDRGGRPFTDNTGKRVLIVGKSLRLEGAATALQQDQGRDVELLGVLGRHLNNFPEENQPVAKSRWPMLFPLVKSPLFERAVETEEHVSIPVDGGGVVGLPKYRPTSKAATNASEADWRLHQAGLQRSFATLSVPVLDADGLVAPIIPIGKQISPLLAVDKWVGDAMLGANTDSTLGANTDSTLGVNTDSTLGIADDVPLGANTDSTLGGDDRKLAAGGNIGLKASTTTEAELGSTSNPLQGTSAGKAPATGTPSAARTGANATKPIGTVYGTSKSHYVEVLETQGKTQGMFFRLIFLESCQSQLSADQLKQLQPKGTKHIGQIWSSDARGLRYSTCDYGRAFDALDGKRTFSEALSQALQTKFSEEEQARAALLK